MQENTVEKLRQLQALPLAAKLQMSEDLIVEWLEHFNGMVYTSFSGGKDSTVLKWLVEKTSVKYGFTPPQQYL